MPSDAELASGIRLGDVAALETLHRQHVSACLAVARGLLKDRHLAEDVCQDVFLALWRRPEGYQPQRGSMRSWLLTITRNKCIDRLRAEQRRPSSGPNDPAAALAHLPSLRAGPDIVAVTRLEADRLMTALRDLPVDQRRVVALAYLGEYSQSEISRLISVPLGTVKGRTAAGMRALGTALTDLQPA